MTQTLTVPFGEIRDVSYPQAWARYLTVQDGDSYFGISITDLAHDAVSPWSDLYNIHTEMLVGLATGTSVPNVLHRLLSDVPPGQASEPNPAGALRKALGTYAEPVSQAMDVACLYRGKPCMVMWPHTGVDKPGRLRSVARAWDFLPDYEAGDVPVYRRHVNFIGMISDTSEPSQ